MPPRASVTGRAAPWWPVWVAAIIRLATWFVIPARFASDEDSYYQVATALLAGGERDLFWPPFTPWLIALVRLFPGADQVAAVRLAWVLMDIACVLLVRTLAIRVAPMVTADAPAARRLATLATLAYAVYVPAISFSQFATSEMPALLQVLGILVLLTSPAAGWYAHAGAGVMAGTVALTRPSLLPLMVLLPAAQMAVRPAAARACMAMLLSSCAIVGGYLAWNWRHTGELSIGRNSAYNLYIGNRDMYAEDLNLFRPAATPGQIEFRRQMWSGELQYPTGSAQQLQREALSWIADHPATFIRRSAGRLARVFVPRTDVLELAGGEQAGGVFNPLPLALLLAANAQWTVVLFAGVPGLVLLWNRDRNAGALFLAAIAGSVALCLIAISKPRYSFVFDPLLILAAIAALHQRRQLRAALSRRQWLAVGVTWAFLAWGWIAWLIFAITSRT